MAQLHDAKRALLKEGLVSCPDALIAVREFLNEIQGRCQEILKKRLPDLSGVLGCNADPKNVKPYTHPTNLITGGLSDGLWLGAQWQIPGFEMKFCVTLAWWEEDNRTECYADTFFEADGDRLLGFLSQKFPQQVSSEFNGIDIRERVSPDVPEACLTKVDGIVRKWIDLWRMSGDLSAIKPRRSRRKA